MSDYAIGDVHGCYDALQRLLEHIQFDDKTDRLWFVGDLVNRGPDSLAVLRWIRTLRITPRITLGNHDLHLLGRLFTSHRKASRNDTLDDVLNAPDSEELGHWLRQQSILYYDASLQVVMCHAGIPPLWNLAQALSHANELERALAGDQYRETLSDLFGNEPSHWTPTLSKTERLRIICNYFTRMRCCHQNGDFNGSHKGSPQQKPTNLYPWYEAPERQPIKASVVFGHWAALNGECSAPGIYALDTGCAWGRRLTALCLQNLTRFSVSNQSMQNAQTIEQPTNLAP